MMQTTRRPLLMGALAAGLWAAEARAQSAADFLGEWFGALDLGSQRLRLRLVVSEGPSATLYSIDQGNSAIPVESISIEGPSISLALPVIGASFSGRLSGGRIEGQFTQRGTLPLVFTRDEVAETAPPPEALTQARLAALRVEAGSPAFLAGGANRDGRSILFVDGVRALGRPEPAASGDKWHLGSITKSMTATLVARAAEAGAISWTDTIGDVLGGAIPEMRAEYRDITFRHLCSHRAGLPANIEMADLVRFSRDANVDARAERVGYARLGLQQAPEGPKEETFVYSNTGYVIAGAMLEARLGAPWESLIRQHVFGPLGMTSAGQGAPGTPGAYDQPLGHARAEEGGPLAPEQPGGDADNPIALGPAGRVHATAEDVFKYLAAHRDRTSFLSRESWDLLHTPPFGGPYAMGWVNRGGMLWHNGSNTLWYAEVMFDPGRGVIAIAAANDGRAGEISRPIGAALLGAAQAVL